MNLFAFEKKNVIVFHVEIIDRQSDSENTPPPQKYHHVA